MLKYVESEELIRMFMVDISSLVLLALFTLDKMTDFQIGPKVIAKKVVSQDRNCLCTSKHSVEKWGDAS